MTRRCVSTVESAGSVPLFKMKLFSLDLLTVLSFSELECVHRVDLVEEFIQWEKPGF